ncbi:MAG: DEAD/DEAH box helicase [Alphaproteobacteria bacterium]|nr:DEAD/DEAH box helicase [Alphaproteobacteria bacterium]
MTTFDALGLPESLLKAIEKNGFNTPTPIQVQAIPPALDGRDILGSAATGTGKTAAFALPMIVHLINNPKAMGLVLTPTRELAAQVLSTMQPLLLMERNIKTALLIGGEPMPKQFKQLQQPIPPRIIVGTPGRINDHLKRGSLMLNRASFMVLDETDRMLDMGFGTQIEEVMRYMPKQRQTLLFSATLPPAIIKIASKYQQDPVRIAVDTANKPAAKIKQETRQTGDADKYKHLQAELEVREGSIIIFVKTKFGAAKMAKRLFHEGHAADAIHGDLQQRKRDAVIRNFRDQKIRILVATDVAARGLDIPHIEHVINYDLPQSPEDFIHRIGRTARAGAEGNALSFLSPQDGEKWRAIQRLLNPEVKVERARNDNAEDRQDKRGKKPFGKKKQSWGKQRDQKSWDKKKRFGDKPKSRDARDERDDEDRRSDRRSDERKPKRWGDDRFRNEKPQQSRRSFGDRAGRERNDRDNDGNRKPRERFEADGNRRPREDRRDDNRGNRNYGRRDEARRDDRRNDRPFAKKRFDRDDAGEFRSDSRPAKKRFAGPKGGKPSGSGKPSGKPSGGNKFGKKFGKKPDGKPRFAGNGDKPQQKRRAYSR